MPRPDRKALHALRTLFPVLLSAPLAASLFASPASAQAIDVTQVAQRMDQVEDIGAHRWPGLNMQRERADGR